MNYDSDLYPDLAFLTNLPSESMQFIQPSAMNTSKINLIYFILQVYKLERFELSKKSRILRTSEFEEKT